MPFTTKSRAGDEVQLNTLEEVAALYNVDLDELKEMNNIHESTPNATVEKGKDLKLPQDVITLTPYRQCSGTYICNGLSTCVVGGGGECITCHQCGGMCHVNCVQKLPFGRPHFKTRRAAAPTTTPAAAPPTTPAAATARKAARPKKEKCKTRDDYENHASPWLCPNCDLIRMNLCMAKGTLVPSDCRKSKGSYVRWLVQEYAESVPAKPAKSKGGGRAKSKDGDGDANARKRAANSAGSASLPVPKRPAHETTDNTTRLPPSAFPSPSEERVACWCASTQSTCGECNARQQEESF